MKELLIGIDVGGTFTDAVVLDAADGKVLVDFKLPSTPSDPSAAVIEALQRIAGEMEVTDATVCHGTTVGTNALIERRGARTALLATSGFTDVIELRRQNRPLLYDLSVRVSEPLVPRNLRFGVHERLNVSGDVVEPLEGVADVAHTLREHGIEAVAVSLLHSYANPAHEDELRRGIAEVLPNAFVTMSSDVCAEFREFERTSTTVVNAYIGPTVSRYMRRLADSVHSLGVKHLMIVKSNGGLTSPENAARYPVHLIESGPAAGMIATAAYAKATARPNVIAFDMGGTTAKAGVVQDYKLRVTDEFYADRLVAGRDVGGYPIRSAVLDIVEIGAGGGSIAWIDDGGVLHVGPESAGADPGPACYSRGGKRPTVTDAHAVIGTIARETFEGSGVNFDRDHAVARIEEHIARPMGWSVAKAAHAVIEIAVANMAEMVRLATVRRGLDPRDFSILAFGGAGPLHAGAVGAEVDVEEIVVPPLPGMFSALGALLGEIRHDLSQTVLTPLLVADVRKIDATFGLLRQKATALLAVESETVGAAGFQRFADLRFAGQLFELRVLLGDLDEPVPALEEIERRFRALYKSEFGFDLVGSSVQLVNLRLVATMARKGDTRTVFKDAGASTSPVTPRRTQTYLGPDGSVSELRVYGTEECAGLTLAGPALVEHSGAAVWVRDGQEATIAGDRSISILIRRDR